MDPRRVHALIAMAVFATHSFHPFRIDVDTHDGVVNVANRLPVRG
jgi:hypothetical protein